MLREIAHSGRRFSIVDRPWPVADAAVAKEDAMEIAVQVNGKVRGHIMVAPGTADAEVRSRAVAEPKVVEHLRGKEIVKIVAVPGRLVSIVVK